MHFVHGSMRPKSRALQRSSTGGGGMESTFNGGNSIFASNVDHALDIAFDDLLTACQGAVDARGTSAASRIPKSSIDRHACHQPKWCALPFQVSGLTHQGLASALRAIPTAAFFSVNPKRARTSDACSWPAPWLNRRPSRSTR